MNSFEGTRKHELASSDEAKPVISNVEKLQGTVTLEACDESTNDFPEGGLSAWSNVFGV